MAKEKIIVYSDYACPFCYIGKLITDRLEKDFDVEIEWNGYEIHPGMPPEGESFEELGYRKEDIEFIGGQVRKLAEEYGAKINIPDFGANSQKAIMMTEYARKTGKMGDFQKLVYEAYWLQGKNISDLGLLYRLAREAGIGEEDLKEYMERESDKEYEKIIQKAESADIIEVPTFFIRGKIIKGVKPYEDFKKILQEKPDLIDL